MKITSDTLFPTRIYKSMNMMIDRLRPQYLLLNLVKDNEIYFHSSFFTYSQFIITFGDKASLP